MNQHFEMSHWYYSWNFVHYKSCTSNGSIAASRFSLWEILSSGVFCDAIWSTDRYRG